MLALTALQKKQLPMPPDLSGCFSYPDALLLLTSALQTIHSGKDVVLTQVEPCTAGFAGELSEASLF